MTNTKNSLAETVLGLCYIQSEESSFKLWTGKMLREEMGYKSEFGQTVPPAGLENDEAVEVCETEVSWYTGGR